MFLQIIFQMPAIFNPTENSKKSEANDELLQKCEDTLRDVLNVNRKVLESINSASNDWDISKGQTSSDELAAEKELMKVATQFHKTMEDDKKIMVCMKLF